MLKWLEDATKNKLLAPWLENLLHVVAGKILDESGDSDNIVNLFENIGESDTTDYTKSLVLVPAIQKMNSTFNSQGYTLAIPSKKLSLIYKLEVATYVFTQEI